AQSSRGRRLELTDERLTQLAEANRRFLLLVPDGDSITPGPSTYHRFWFRDAAFMLAALDRYGLHEEAAEVLASYPDRQHADGFFFSQRQEWDSNGAALWSLAEHWRLTRDEDLLRHTARAVARGVRWIDRKRRSKRRRKDAALTGLMPASMSAAHLRPFDYLYWDSFWSARGLLDGAELLDAAGDTALAGTARTWAGELRAAIESSLALVAERLGTRAVPAGPRRRLDPAAIASLVAC